MPAWPRNSAEWQTRGKTYCSDITHDHHSQLGDGYERVASADLLEHVLQIPRAQQTPAHGQRLARAMEHVAWGRNPGGRVTIKGVAVRGYIRRKLEAAPNEDAASKETLPRAPADIQQCKC